MGIEAWSTTPANNNSAPPDGWPEGMAPSAVNDTARQQMADHRSKWEDAQWFDWGHTPTQASATTFKIPTNLTSTYSVGRRLKLYGSVMGTFYGTITASSYAAPDTTITVSIDGGSSLTNNLSRVYTSILTPTNIALPRRPSFFAYRTTDQTIANNTTTKVLFNTSNVDNMGGYDEANSKFVAPIPGPYYFATQLWWEATLVDQSLLRAYITINGSTVVLTAARASGTQSHSINASVLVNLSVGDEVEVYAYQSNGSSENIAGDIDFSHFIGFFVG